MNKQCWIAVLCLGFVSLLGGDRLWAADPERQQLDQLTANMQKEGWKEIDEGVFERQLGPNKVERLGYGREGLEWTLGELNRKLESFQLERASYPSEELDKIIEDLSLQIARTKSKLWKLDIAAEQGLSNVTAAASGGCSTFYSATADAYPQTSAQGVAAVANASFNNACGHSGETYAYAYARATVGTTTTTTTQSDPKTGTSITSSVTASVDGGSVEAIPCSSEASAYVQSSALNISYSTSDVNSFCSMVDCAPAGISGTSYEYFSAPGCRTLTWTVALPDGCTASTYEWKYNGAEAGSGSSYTRLVCQGNYTFTLEATAYGTLTATHTVRVVYGPDEPDPRCGHEILC